MAQRWEPARLVRVLIRAGRSVRSGVRIRCWGRGRGLEPRRSARGDLYGR